MCTCFKVGGFDLSIFFRLGGFTGSFFQNGRHPRLCRCVYSLWGPRPRRGGGRCRVASHSKWPPPTSVQVRVFAVGSAPAGGGYRVESHSKWPPVSSEKSASEGNMQLYRPTVCPYCTYILILDTVCV